ncbi:hypothetical protein P280DRAFT_514351 [Massarina eburnea CBS 473.64]|uniref:Uncharacterized protein n=1 Tax=Massarina eburnea CBS 473.64 TaxID=1395130 RepID=A0A6A6SAS7_9PLEO|nr:hypothetical protein P280DRAFT_514351 [Massarina eburnea CBS 473.64]
MAPATKVAAPPPKAKTNAGVKKAVGPKGAKKQKMREQMVRMQAFFKENRSKYKDQDFKEQQKSLGADWKKSPKNPKNSA